MVNVFQAAVDRKELLDKMASHIEQLKAEHAAALQEVELGAAEQLAAVRAEAEGWNERGGSWVLDPVLPVLGNCYHVVAWDGLVLLVACAI